MRWDEIKVGDIVRVPKGTRRGLTTFAVTEVTPDPYLPGHVHVRGIDNTRHEIWVCFGKSNDFTGFSVKGKDPEFVNGEDE